MTMTRAVAGTIDLRCRIGATTPRAGIGQPSGTLASPPFGGISIARTKGSLGDARSTHGRSRP